MRDPDLVYSFDGSAADLLKYSFLAVSILGLVGNSLSLLTVISKKCKGSSFTVYIGALAVVDSCMLVTNLADTLLLAAYKIDLGTHGIAICKVIKFCQSTFRHISAWVIIAITIERALATLYPLRFEAIYKPRFGVVVVGILASLMTLLHAHFLLVTDYSFIDQGPRCVFKEGPHRTFITETFPVVLFFTAVLLPSFIIIMGNTAIVIKARRSRRQIAPTTSSTRSTYNTSRHLIVITLLISSAFLVFTVPVFAALSITSVAFDDTNDTQRQFVYSVALSLQNMNFAANFYLYILSGRRFRELFISAITCNRKVNPVQVTTGNQKSSSRGRKSINKAATNRQIVSVTIVDETTHSKNSMRTGSRANGKTSSGSKTNMKIDHSGNVKPCNSTRSNSLLDATTGVGIQPQNTTIVTRDKVETISTNDHQYGTSRDTSLQDGKTSDVEHSSRDSSLQDGKTSNFVQPDDSTRVSILQDGKTSDVVHSARVTNLQDGKTSDVVHSARVTNLQDGKTSDVVHSARVTNLQDGKTSDVEHSSRVSSLQDAKTSVVVQPDDSTRVTSLQDGKTSDDAQPDESSRVTNLQDGKTSNNVQPGDTPGLQDDSVSDVIQPYDPTKNTALQHESTINVIQPRDTTRVTIIQDNTSSGFV